MADFTYTDAGFSATTVLIRPNTDAARERMGLGKYGMAAEYRKSDAFALLDEVIAEGFKVVAQ